MNRRRFAERLLTSAPLLGATLLASNSARAEPQQPRVASPAKLTLLHVRAADVADALGGSVVDGSANAPASVWGKEKATQLLPEGITSILAYNRDNSLLVQFDDPAALTAFRNVIRLLDVAARLVEVRVVAEALVRDGGRGGKTTRVELRTITLGGQGARASSTQSEERKVAGGIVHAAAPRITAFEWYVAPDVMENANASLLRVTARGSVTVAWQKPGTKAKTEPVRVQHFFDGTTQTRSGIAAVVSRATLPLGDTGATAEINLTLTPRLLTGAATSRPSPNEQPT